MTSDPRQRLEAERTRLSAVRDSLQRDLAGESENASVSELSDADQHPSDLGTETFNRERDIGLLESVEAELADVDSALERLEGGTYGTCEACGKPIGADRLAALPATRFCIEDAALAEQEAAGGTLPP